MLRRSIVRLGVLAAAAVALPVASADASELAADGSLFVDCGETIGDEPEELADFTVGNNLICTSGDAITVTAPANGITIDLGGHRLSGDGGLGEDGIVINGANQVTLSNGVLSGFDRGVLVQGNQNIVDGVTLVDNNGDSIQVTTSSDTEIRGNTIVRGGNLFLTDTATGTIVEDNLFVKDSIVLSGSDSNAIRSNEIIGAGINSANGPDGSQTNRFEANDIVAPPTAGITSSGDASDGNDILGNTITGAGQRGIDVNDGDNAEVKNNVVSGSAQDGIELRGTATGADVENNQSNANTDDGFALGVSATGADLDGNTANENGDNGIEAQNGAAPAIDGTTANFNGFLNGLINDDGLGISSPDGTTSTGNAANGNDVATPSASQCNLASLCAAPALPAADPPVIACNTVLAVANTVTLRHPLDCASGDAVAITGNNVVLNLGKHRVSGGALAADASVSLTASRSTVRGGVIADSQRGIRVTGGSENRIEDAVVARAPLQGISISGSDENTVQGGASVDSGSSAVLIEDGDLNRIAGMDVAGNGVGVVLKKTGADPGVLDDRSSKNKVTSNRIVGTGGIGVQLSDANANVVRNNVVVGNASGIQAEGTVTGSPRNLLEDNEVRASTFSGILVAGAPGSPQNKLVSNVVSANTSGISVGDPDSTGVLVTRSAARNNDQEGIHFAAPSGKALRNKVTGNGRDGILFDLFAAGRIENNRTNANGFLADSTAAPIGGDDVGLGLSALPGGKGCGNTGANNDDPDQIEPAKFRKTCK